MKHIFPILIYGLLALQLTGCDYEHQQMVADRATQMSPSSVTPAKDESLVASTANDLCKQLPEIKKLPSRDPSNTDPIYEAIIARGEEVIPCLVDEITNETPMSDPREAPVWAHYKVGDTAVFVLVDIIKKEELLEEMLPSKYRNEWKTNGIYAYFNYVSDEKNRRQLQQWWRDWSKKNIKQNVGH